MSKGPQRKKKTVVSPPARRTHGRGVPAGDGDIGDDDCIDASGKTLVADAGGSMLVGSRHDDRISGRGGADRLHGQFGDDVLEGGRGNDVLLGGAGDDFLYGGPDNDTLHGGPGRDQLLGGKGNDTLLGGRGGDRLHGDRGNDLLDGGRGNDLLDGGPGNDVYLFGVGDGHDTLDNQPGRPDDVDVVRLRAGIAREQVWFRRDGNDLTMILLGDCDSMTLLNWYGDAQRRIDRFELADGKRLAADKIDALVAAMAGFEPVRGNTVPIPGALLTSLESLLAQSWQ